MESTQNMDMEHGSTESMNEQEYEMRLKYLRQPNETKEQREARVKNVRAMLKESRDSSIGVKDEGVLSAFSRGRGEF